jgi:hypothetical protein
MLIIKYISRKIRMEQKFSSPPENGEILAFLCNAIPGILAEAAAIHQAEAECLSVDRKLREWTVTFSYRKE